MIETAFKQKVIDRLKEAEKASGLSAKRFSTTLGLSQSQWSRLKKGEIDGVLSDSKFITYGREYGIQMGEHAEWKIVKTATFQYVHSLLETCYGQKISTIFVDLADIGKTTTAKYFARNNSNAVYVDCSQVKSKQLFVREIAKKFGSDYTGKYADVFGDLVYYLNTLPGAMVILDEAGDLKYEAFLELKALWNATEGNVGWFMMGAEGLQHLMDRSISYKRVGYSEIFRRYGSRYRKVCPLGGDALSEFKRDQIAMVAVANTPEGTDIQRLVTASGMSLTNLSNIIKVSNYNKTA